MRKSTFWKDDQTVAVADLHLWRKILGYSAPFAPWFFGAVLLSLVISGTTLLLPKLLQLAIDTYIMADTQPLSERVQGVTDLALVYGGAVLVLFGSGFLQVIVLERIGQAVMQRIRVNLFANILRLEISFFNKQPVGNLVTRLTNDISNMHEMFTSVLVEFFNDFLKISGTLIILFMIHPGLALVMSLYLPLSIGIVVIFSKMARKVFRIIRSQFAEMNSFLQESVSGVDIVQQFNRENDYLKKFSELSAEYMASIFRQIKLFGTFMPLVEFLSISAVAVILLYGGHSVLKGGLTLGELVAFIAYMKLFFRPVRELSQKYSIVQSALASAERIFLLLDTKSQLKSYRSSLPMVGIKGEIKFEKVSFAYGEDKNALTDINVDIKQGETVAIVGPTGSGKSTFLDLLLHFYEPNQGRILLDDEDISRYNPKEFLEGISIIMQETIFIPGTVLDNITLQSGKGRDHVEKILAESGIDTFIERLPKGLDTWLHNGATNLSAGEKQLISMARALCRDTQILIMDEATSFVDTETEAILGHALGEFLRYKTAFIIAHRLSTIEKADRIIVLEGGRIIEQGSHTELMNKGGKYHQLISIDRQLLPAGTVI